MPKQYGRAIANRQTQNIDEDLLPIDTATSSPTKNLDLAIAIVPSLHCHDAIIVEQALKRHGRISQMTDVYSSTVPLVCGIEVKDTGGDKNEAIAQLAIWSTTSLRHVKKTIGLPAIKLLPFVGWTVIGHRWDLYITWLKSDDGVVFWGPVLSSRTSSYVGLFKILKLLERMDKWMSEVYWSWLRGIFQRQQRAKEEAERLAVRPLGAENSVPS